MTYIDLANRYGLDPNFIWNLIQVESGWNPQAKNPNSSARGLIQFIDSTARDLGYLSSLDLVNKNPTVEAQLNGPVRAYWDKWVPFRDEMDLAACNFYPAYRNKPNARLPEKVIAANSGITTIAEYYNRVNKTGGKKVTSGTGGNGILFVLGAIALGMLS